MFVISIDKEKCKNCGECVKICPVELYKLQDNQVIVGNTEECSGCKSCVEVCEAEAIEISEA